MATIFLISDTHFGHVKMLEFLRADGTRVRREFSNVKEMDEAMVERWNTTVKPQDHVYHLGDFTMDHKLVAKYARQLNGHKRLVLGNHDHYDPRVYYDAGFKKVYSSRSIEGLVLTHIPIHFLSIPLWGLGNVHGHTHAEPAYGPEYQNVSVEQINYTPIALETVKARFLK